MWTSLCVYVNVGICVWHVTLYIHSHNTHILMHSNLFVFYVYKYFSRMYICALCECLLIMGPEEGIWTPGAVVTDGYKLPYGCWDLYLAPLEKQAVLLSAESSPQLPYYFLRLYKVWENKSTQVFSSLLHSPSGCSHIFILSPCVYSCLLTLCGKF